MSGWRCLLRERERKREREKKRRGHRSERAGTFFMAILLRALEKGEIRAVCLFPSAGSTVHQEFSRNAWVERERGCPDEGKRARGGGERERERGKHRDRFDFFQTLTDGRGGDCPLRVARRSSFRILLFPPSEGTTRSRSLDLPGERIEIPPCASREPRGREDGKGASDRGKKTANDGENSKTQNLKISSTDQKNPLSPSVPRPGQALRPHPRPRRAREARQRREQGVCLPVRRQVHRRPDLRR